MTSTLPFPFKNFLHPPISFQRGKVCLREQHVWGAYQSSGWSSSSSLSSWSKQSSDLVFVSPGTRRRPVRQRIPFPDKKTPVILVLAKNSQNCQEGPTAEALDAGKEISLSENAGLSGPLALCLGCWSGWRQWTVGDQRAQGHFVWCVPTPHFIPDGVMK